jgi:hypothetical protein
MSGAQPDELRSCGGGVTAALVRRWLDAGELELPAPGSGRTGSRWWKLAALTENDVVARRLAEGRVADLTIYVRQSQAERDLADLGKVAAR